MSSNEDGVITMVEEFTLTGWSKLGGLVRDTRLSKGLSQATVASQAGVARSWLSRVEAGHRGVELEPLLRLLGALDLTLILRSTAENDQATDPPPDQASTGTAVPPRKPPQDRAHTELRSVSEARRASWGLPIGDGDDDA
ncbi:multiprotein-bridging factor 1 family protein [Nocardiopsis alba]|uniref:helix-turn-helix domain-containing protein n=2 Tax=Nocardiopsis TaxID=2013 RepID=UPI00366D445B